MKKILLWLLAVTSVSFSLPTPLFQSNEILIKQQYSILDDVKAKIGLQKPDALVKPLSLNEIRRMLESQGSNLNPLVINRVLTSLKCANKFNLNTSNILTIIDYSLPSSEKRLWVFDLNSQQLLFYTYVSHGIKSGTLLTKYFSNRYNSKSSSLGVYATEKAYYGREGISLRLDGLERGFNDNANNRSVVMHGGWYMDEHFIQRYGRAGRSWGCPAVPLDQVKNLINTIKEQSLLIIYYPDDEWFLKSKFLNCENLAALQTVNKTQTLAEDESRENILFADLKKNSSREETDPILVMSADNYEKTFKTKAPLERMLRRQIDKVEYIALSEPEFRKLFIENTNPLEINENLSHINFIIPYIIRVRGYYETQMKIVNLGKIKEIKINDANTLNNKIYTLIIEEKPALTLRASNQFIRWLGL